MACFSFIVTHIVEALSLDAFSASDTLITDRSTPVRYVINHQIIDKQNYNGLWDNLPVLVSVRITLIGRSDLTEIGNGLLNVPKIALGYML